MLPLTHDPGILLCGYLIYPLLKQTCVERGVPLLRALRCAAGCVVVCLPYILMQGGAWLNKHRTLAWHSCLAEAVFSRHSAQRPMYASSFASLLEEMAYRTYCVGYPAEARAPWCHKRVPSLYSYVQAQYWDVGFLRFYHKLARV